MKRATILLAGLAAFAVSACAGQEKAETQPAGEEQPREVDVVMTDFRFTISDTVFVAGVEYRFVLRNTGQEPHEWAVVPRGEVDEENLLVEVEEEDLPPGATLVFEYTFPEAGEYDFACFMPGHYEAGMVMPIRVIGTAEG
ncbi:MAG TPA: cupredoxin domain-containing protein [Longimicrobiales bacterium]|nr:cupredoxin domain-containing protein [Longimicrobiales bacterium]